MKQQNPYQAPLDRSRPAPAQRWNASVFWFIATAFLGTLMVMSLWAPEIEWTVRGLLSRAVYAVVVASVGLASVQLVGLFRRRRYPATRLSRMIAGGTFAAAGPAVGTTLLQLGVTGPPGTLALVTIPSAAILSVVADRLVAQFTGPKCHTP